MERRQKILLLARAAEAAFSSSEWTEVGYITATDEYIDRHPRLLRSLSWGDSDYKGHVIDAVANMLDKDPENLKRLLEYEPIVQWLIQHEPARYEEVRAEVYELEVAEVVPVTSTDSGLAALADAQALLRTRGPTSAVDRVHTGLQDFLKSACDGAGIAYPQDPTANQLLKPLLDHHPKLQDLGPRSEDVRRMLKASAAMVDALGTVRNRASLAHPNEELVDADAALLAINMARSLLRYLDAKLTIN
jgi:hypothetical protein